ncbi:Gfo/Idh/MocA family protein [Paenibacillus piri]|nr:Gfo/Idh/MocA family oxidoreductase [Paenibacillus piri]
MKRFKIAVIGAGDMGRNHVRSWIAAGHHVVTLCDVDEERSIALAHEFNVPNFVKDYKEAINDPQIEIVSICLPLVFHAPVTIYAAQQGKHVFCEKPLASSAQAAMDMQAAVEKAGVQFGVGFQRNYSNGVEQVKQWVQEDRFGRPLVMNCDLLQEVRPKLAMHDRNGNQGPVVDACCHAFMMWQTVFQSKPKMVYARGGIMAHERPEIAHFDQLAIDTAVITVEYESGDIGTMTVSWGLAKKFKLHGRADRIIGPKGGAEGHFNNFGNKTLQIELYDGENKETVELPQPDLFKVQFQRFAAAVEEGRPAPVGFTQGRDMLKLSHAVLESIETGKIVCL